MLTCSSCRERSQTAFSSDAAPERAVLARVRVQVDAPMLSGAPFETDDWDEVAGLFDGDSRRFGGAAGVTVTRRGRTLFVGSLADHLALLGLDVGATCIVELDPAAGSLRVAAAPARL